MGIRKADEFGARCVQGHVFDDPIFRDKKMSEDCLYLTVWAPAKPASKRLPVYVWYYGGGFVAGASDEPRYDGESLAKQGIIVVNVNYYRLGIFGFFSHPDLTKESPHKASGNCGPLDQVAALEWVKKNVAAFGGDPKKVTIGGESAGSMSVSALMASPLARGLFHQAVGESGAFFAATGGRDMPQLAESEEQGAKFAAALAGTDGAKSLANLRGLSANDLLAAAMKPGSGASFRPNVDGYFLPSDVRSIYAQGGESRVPLVAGWNAGEVRMRVLLAKEKPNAETFPAQFKDKSDAALKVYPASTDAEAFESAGDLASDSFIVFGTWKWLDAQTKTGKPVYRFQFDRKVPIPDAMKGTGLKTLGAAHASELEYVFDRLDAKKADWQPEDQKVADTMNKYWGNFMRMGDPNGVGLAKWPDYAKTHEVRFSGVPAVDCSGGVRISSGGMTGRVREDSAHSTKPTTFVSKPVLMPVGS